MTDVPRPFFVKTPDIDFDGNSPGPSQNQGAFPISVAEAAETQLRADGGEKVKESTSFVKGKDLKPFPDHERMIGVLVIIIAVSLLILAETLAEPPRSLYERNIRFLLAIGMVVSLIIVSYAVYGLNRSYESAGYSYAGFIILLLLLSISHRVGYGLAVFVSVLMVILLIGITAITKSIIVLIPLVLAFLWSSYVIFTIPSGDTF